MKARGFYEMVAVAALLVLAACAETDAGITAKVKAKLAADDQVKASQIDVTTADHAVTLTGNVDSEDARERALTLTRDTKGVTEVHDMLSVRTAAGTGDAPDVDRSPGTVLDDATITMSVKTKLLSDDLVKGTHIDVDTRAGIVYLTGDVGSDAERDQAVRLARETEGVRDVQANLTVAVR